MKNALTTLAVVLGLISWAQQQNTRPIQHQVHPSFIALNQAQQGLNPQQIFNEIYQLSSDDHLELISVITDDVGQKHEKYQQEFKGIVVEGAQVTLHYKDNVPSMVSGYFSEIGNLPVQTQMTNSSALKAAKQKVNAKTYAWEAGKSVHMHMEEPHGELVVFTDPTGFTPSKLAYKIDIYALDPIYRADVFVDASTGNVL
ncbi:MAG: hypothetical protein N4A46_00500, partial [Schleiferiaceae bacterium]|nr:hypothetical protein [Schleiferiaceae bacterium]